MKTIEDYLVKLSVADNYILSSYCSLCECLASYLGSTYEVVVHSLGIGDRFIRRIINNEYSGRTESDSLDRMSVTIVEQLYARIKQGDSPIIINFSTGGYYPVNDTNPFDVNSAANGTFRSASIGIVGSGKKLIGMLCLNFYLDAPFSKIIENYTLPGFLTATSVPFHASSNSYDEYLYETIDSTKQTVMNNHDIPSKYKRKEIIRILNDIGVFNVKKGVMVCAEALGITITTIYMHIRNLDATTDESQ